MAINVSKSLKKFSAKTVRDIQDRIWVTKTIDTGDLLSSISSYQVGTFVQFSMLDYGKFTDSGTKFISPRKFFNHIIERNSNELEDLIGDDIELEIDRVMQESGKLKSS